MKKYILSISDEELREHLDYKAITAKNACVPIPDRGYSSVGFGEIGSDQRWYFIGTDNTLALTVDYLLNNHHRIKSVTIQKATRGNLPPNLRTSADLSKILS
jgi:hypothetical protein